MKATKVYLMISDDLDKLMLKSAKDISKDKKIIKFEDDEKLGPSLIEIINRDGLKLESNSNYAGNGRAIESESLDLILAPYCATHAEIAKIYPKVKSIKKQYVKVFVI